MSIREENILKPVRHRLNEVMPTGSKVVLFGSRARGDANRDSDWDMLMLIDKVRISNEDFDEYAFPLIELGWQLGIVINPILFTYKDWEKRRFTPLYQSVKEEGIDIWQ